jgi:hypothetical protein
MSERLNGDGAKQGTQAPSPAPRLIPAETEDQLRTNIAIGTANGGTSTSYRCKRRSTSPWRCGAMVPACVKPYQCGRGNARRVTVVAVN